jgi:hypothetical protein
VFKNKVAHAKAQARFTFIKPQGTPAKYLNRVQTFGIQAGTNLNVVSGLMLLR